MADQLAPVYWRALDSNGDFVPSAQAYWYVSGTTTPLTVYQDEALTSAHATPQLADASGVFDQVFVASGTDAKVVVKDPSDSSTLYTIDPVPLTSTGGAAASNITFAAVTGNSATEVQTAVANNVTRINRLDNGSRLAVSTGSGGAYALTSALSVTSYAVGQSYEFIANHASVGSGTDTLNVDSVGPVVIKKYSGTTSKTDLAAGDIGVGETIRAKYDGTHFILLGVVSASETLRGLVEAATTAEMTAGTANKFPDAAKVKAFYDGKRFTSSGQTITTAGLLTLAHGLGAVPRHITMWIVCTDAGGDVGYSQNDKVMVTVVSSSSALNRYNSVYVDSTNVYVRFDSASGAFIIGNKGTGVAGVITDSKWQLYIEASL